MRFQKNLIASILAIFMSFGGSAALAQYAATPAASPVAEVVPQPIYSTDGELVGYITLTEDAKGVHIVIESAVSSPLPAGEHGLHIHETGVCDPDSDPAFSSAGGHFNPTDEHHGDVNADPSHGGDLGNLVVSDDGSFHYEVTVTKITLASGEANSLNDADGAAIVIHEGTDDLMTDPSGDSGDREACGVIFAPTDLGTPVATPVATPQS